MKFSCPKCQVKLNIPAERIPPSGAWAKCPRCTERFFIPAPHQGLNLAPTPRLRTPSPGDKNQDRHELLSKLKKKGGAGSTGAEPLNLSEITIYPEYSTSPLLRKVIFGIALLIPLVFVVVIFFQATPPVAPVPAPSPTQTAELVEPQDSEDDIRLEILFLRQRFQLSSQFNFVIDFSGLETRIFKYFMRQLIPDICTNISSLHMSSTSPRFGFKAVGSCIDEGAPPEVVMDVKWGGRTAIITFPGLSRDSYELKLF